MEPSREAISVRLTRLRNQLLGSTSTTSTSLVKRALHREALLDALTALYHECNNEALMKHDEHIAKFVEKYRCVIMELHRMRVNVEDFDIKELIGRGHFGEVHVVREKLTGDVYAMKRLRKDETLQQKEVAFYQEERDIMAQAASPWVTRLQYAFQDTNNLYLVMEFCPGGDLAGLLERRGEPLSLSAATFYVAELNQALGALHTCGFLHRDMKPDNVLIDRCGHLKLTDFGSAIRIGQSGRATSRVPIGTPDYIAPELLSVTDNAHPTTHGAAVDYWSLGVIAYELITLHTPFAERNKISTAHTFNNIQRFKDGKFTISWPTRGPSDCPEEGPSDAYKDLVFCLLRVDASKRYNYLETLRHPALKNLSWNTIRDQVPPFVPLVRSTDDTSHFSECPAVPPRASAGTLRNFRSKVTFSGNNLPFIGFTYTPEAYVCCSHGANDSTGSDSSGGFSTSSNMTAIHLNSFKQVEKLAERRGEEIETLQQRTAAAESQALLQKELVASLEQQRTKLEQEVTDLIVNNQRLSRQLQMEHEERQDMERKSLELIEQAKRKWMEKSRTRIDELRSQIANQELRLRDKNNDNDQLKRRIEDLTVELRTANLEVEAVKKLQLNYKDSMAKARAVSRASIAGFASEAPSVELARERDARSKAESEAKAAAERAKKLEDEETALRVELSETRKDFDDLKVRYAALEEECFRRRRQSESTSHQRSAAERRGEQLEVRVRELERQLAAEKRDSAALRDTVEELSRQQSEWQQKESALEEQHARTTARLQDKLTAAEKQCVDTQTQLTAARQSDHRHRDKVSELERLVMKLEREVSKLEVARKSGGVRSPDNIGATAQIQLLKEQLATSSRKLEETQENLTKLKEESRKTSMTLWKKEKELADCDLDKRIAVRELKAAEEKLTRLTESRRAANESALAEKKRLETALTNAETALAEAKNEAREAKEKLEEAEKRLAEHERVARERKNEEDRLNAEIDRLKNDVRKLKCELQYSENRRLKTEASIDREREELRKAHDDRLTVHEELAALKASLEERTRTVENLELNNKMLQEACTMLEEQVTDVERLSDLQENKSKSMEAELARIRSDLETCRESLRETEKRAAEYEQKVGHAIKKQADDEEYIQELLKQIESLEERRREKESRCSQAELCEAAVAAERDSLARKLSAAGLRLRQVQEECSNLLTSNHQLMAQNMMLQHRLDEAEEALESAREANETAAAWWRTRETKADATLRQQAKLIDFLQSKVEEAGRKKKTLSGMLFGHRTRDKDITSTPSNSTDITRALLKEREANRELREELARLKSQLPANSPLLNKNKIYTPKLEKRKTVTKLSSKIESHETEQLLKNDSERYIQIIRETCKRERVPARAEDGVLLWRRGASEQRARLVTPTPAHTDSLSAADVRNAFTVRTITCPEEDSETVTVVCESETERTYWLSRLAAPGAGEAPARGLGYAPRAIVCSDTLRPTCVMEVRSGLYAIGSDKGLFSYGTGQPQPVHVSTPELSRVDSLHLVVQASRVLLECAGVLYCTDMRLFLSTMERGAVVQPELSVERVTNMQMLEVMPRRYSAEKALICVVNNRRILFLTRDLASDWKTLKAVEISSPPSALLFTPHTLLVASDQIYEIDLKRYNIEEFLDFSDDTLEAVARASRPRAILPIKDRSADEETEYLICYPEVGVFVDEFGRRTRSEDVKWSGTAKEWSYRKPYLFVVQSDRVEVSKLDDNSYKQPPCQCDSESLASSNSDHVPERCIVNLQSPAILGNSHAAGALILREGAGPSSTVVEIDGTKALKKIGVSVETLNSADYSDVARPIDEPDAARSDNESTTTLDTSCEGQSNFLADIRRRAKQIRGKVHEQQRKDEAIREILTKEISGKFVPGNRRNSIDSADSEFSVESSEQDGAECHVVGKTTAEICADMFMKKQVRFDGK